MTVTSPIIKKKREALDHFVETLQLKNEAIYRIFLFGSVLNGTSTLTSDIDVAIIFYGDKKAILEDVTESMLLTTLDTSNQVEPVLYSLEEFRVRKHQSLFLSQLTKNSEVIWMNDDSELPPANAGGFLRVR